MSLLCCKGRLLYPPHSNRFPTQGGRVLAVVQITHLHGKARKAEEPAAKLQMARPSSLEAPENCWGEGSLIHNAPHVLCHSCSVPT